MLEGRASLRSLSVRRSALVLVLALVAGAESLRAASLTILTWNIWHGTFRTERAEKLRLPGESTSHRSLRIDHQIELLRRAQPDVLLLQEVPQLPSLVKRYATALGYDEIHKVTGCGVRVFGWGIPVNVRHGLAILARPELRLRSLGSVRLSGTWSFCSDLFGFQLHEGRYALLAEITTARGDAYLLVNAHLHNQPRVSAELDRQLEERRAAGRLSAKQLEWIHEAVESGERRKLDEIGRLLQAAERARGTRAYLAGAVLGGDINASPESEAIGRLVGGSWVDAAGALHRRAFPTYDLSTNSLAARVTDLSALGYPTFGDPELVALGRRERDRTPRRTDYVFVSSEMPNKVVSAERFGQELGYEPKEHDRSARYQLPLMGSDHYGVFVRLSIPD